MSADEAGSPAATATVAGLAATTEARAFLLSIARHQHRYPAPTTPLAPGAALTVIATRQGLARAID